MGVSKAAVKASAAGTFTMSGDMLVRLCLAGGLSVDAMLETKLTSGGRCAACGPIEEVSMQGPTLVIDLETVPDPDLPAPPKKRGSKKGDDFPPIPCHRIVTTGAALLDAFGQLRRLWIVGEESGGTELDIGHPHSARDVAQHAARAAQRARACGLEYPRFDMLVIAARALRHGLAFPWYYESHGARYRYGYRHLDLMDFLSDYGAGRVFSFDLTARLVGMPGKVGCAGDDVGKLVAGGSIEEVRAYCLSDVARTVALFLRVQILRGEFDHRGLRDCDGGAPACDRAGVPARADASVDRREVAHASRSLPE
ncbi:MAG TPA: hypothetical protein VE093_03945 [Polyangiaceae bacterium]|nr:hypothetical protein [Polyangiaceae bacterium]